MPTRSSSREKAIEREETQNQPQKKGGETNHEPDNTLQTAKACSLPSIRHQGVRINLLRTRASWKWRHRGKHGKVLRLSHTSHNGLDTASRNPHSHKADGDPSISFTNIKNKEPETKRINERIDDAKQDVLKITDRMPYPGWIHLPTGGWIDLKRGGWINLKSDIWNQSTKSPYLSVPSFLASE